MYSARLLAAAVLFCSLAFAQSQQALSSSGPAHEPERDSLASAEVPVVAWSSPNRAAYTDGTDAFFQGVERYKLPARPRIGETVFPSTVLNAGVPSNTAHSSDDTICYSIRSYQVARDSKDTDAVHPVGSSTCQPGSRFHLKSADVRLDPAQR